MKSKNIRKFTVDWQSIDNLKEQFCSRGLEDCIYTLDSLVKYAEMRYGKLSDEYSIITNPNLTDSDIKDYERKIATAERKFKYMIDVPNLCLQRSTNNNYANKKTKLLTTVGILHDIGRIDEIISQNKDSVFKLKVDHASIGADYLFGGDALTKSDRIYDFVNEELADRYGDLIENCIRYHGSYKVPMEYFQSKLGKALIKDIRLIDKISIMNSFLVEDMSTVIGISLEELAELHISDGTYCELMTVGTIDRKKEGEPYTPIRHFLSHVGFIYDMDDYTLLDDRWVDRYMDMYNPKAKIDQLRKDEIVKSTKQYIRRNLMR